MHVPNEARRLGKKNQDFTNDMLLMQYHDKLPTIQAGCIHCYEEMAWDRE